MVHQINVRLSEKLENASNKFVEEHGYKNIQELIAEALREKVIQETEFDESFSEKELELIDQLVELSIKQQKLKTEDELMRALE